METVTLLAVLPPLGGERLRYRDATPDGEVLALRHGGIDAMTEVDAIKQFVAEERAKALARGASFELAIVRDTRTESVNMYLEVDGRRRRFLETGGFADLELPVEERVHEKIRAHARALLVPEKEEVR